jgi:hypothetical protein
MDGLWLQKLADWAWLAILGMVGFIYRLASRVTTSEGRLAALEAGQAERTAAIQKIDTKLDSLRQEFRDDHRMVMTELLKKVPPA